MEQQVKLELSIKEINVILQSLGQMPFAQVVEVIQKVKTQAESQLQQPQAAE